MAGQRVKIEVDDQVTLTGEFSEGQKGAAVVLHPHPLYGGSMHNNVVDALARAAAGASMAVLKFNFRGVGGSSGQHDQGRGEQDDVLAATDWLARRAPAPLVLMGYSFGSLVGSAAAADLAGLAGGVWVSPPWVMGPLAPWPAGAGPLLVLAGGRDEYGDLAALEGYMSRLGALGRLEAFPEADHFWWGHESALIEKAQAFLTSVIALS